MYGPMDYIFQPKDVKYQVGAIREWIFLKGDLERISGIVLSVILVVQS